MKNKIFFIIGCPRSGTTALAKILNAATNAEVFIEQEPKMCIAARIQYEFDMPLAEEFIKKSKENKIKETHDKGLIYGDKNPNFLFFVDELLENFDCKFIFMFRDGRDSVRSMMEWDMKGKPYYERYEDQDNSTIIQPEDDFWDFTRIRPKQNEEIYAIWRNLSKFEKISWYWSKFNEIMLEKAKQLNKDKYMLLEISGADAAKIKELFDFLGLEGFDEAKITEMLTGRINSITNKWDEKDKYPKWTKWEPALMEKFYNYAKTMMEKLGYKK